jgi:hypothetical protein
VIVARNLPAAFPAEVDTTSPALHLVTAFSLFDRGGALRAVPSHPLQVSQCQEFGLSKLCFSAAPASTYFQCLDLISDVGAFPTWMENAPASSTENETAQFALCHVILVLDAGHMLAICIAPRAERHVAHCVKTAPQVQFFPAGQHL